MCNSLQPDGLGKVLTRSEEKGTAGRKETNSKWPMVPLGEVLAQYKEYIECPEPKVYQKLSVKLYGKGVILDTPTDGTALKMKRHQIAKAGQVILSEIWGKKGAIGFVPPEGDGALCTSHFFLFEFNPGRIDQKYLQAIFAANYLQDQLDAEAKGTTGYAAVRPKILFDAKIPLPTLDEQRRIVARIEELAARIEEARELRRRAVEDTYALQRSYYSKYFLNLDREKNKKIPLRDLVNAFGGGTPSKHNAAYWDGNIPWISPKDMTSIELYDGEDHITENAISESSTSLVPSDSILIVVRSGILRRTIPIAINRVPVAINQDLKALIPCNRAMPEYIRWWFNPHSALLTRASEFSAVKYAKYF